ncbi:MAG: YczE/YyaS/YitT family protein [Actinomycetota bacterium]
MREFLERFKPHRTVPQTPWSAQHRWDLKPKRLTILLFGLFIFGIGDSLLIVSDLGNAPWSVLAQGISRQSSLSVGEATLVISALVLLLWIPLKERPGFGTLANMVVIATAIDIGINNIPHPQTFLPQLFYVLVGITLVGTGSALYITCALGPGPRDGWMTSIHKRTGWPVGRVRLGIELSVLALGVILGGTAGLGTALFALLIGYSVAMAFGVVARLTAQ